MEKMCTIVNSLVKSRILKVGVSDGSNLSVCLADSGVTSGGAMLVGLGLISLNQLTNRLRQLNAVFVISLLAMVLSLPCSGVKFGHAPYTRTLEWAAAGNSPEYTHH